MTPLVPWRPALVLAALGGVLLWLAFPPVSAGLFAVPGVALLAAAAWGASLRRGLLTGAIGGAVFFGLLLLWMQVIGVDAWLGLTLLCAAWIALLGAGTSLVTRLPAAPVWVACLWVLEEALRGRIPLGGFPWGNLAFSQPDTPLGHWVPLGGTPVGSFAVALAGAALVAAYSSLRGRNRGRGAGWVATAIMVVLLPLAVPSSAVIGESTGTAAVAIVQGGTPQVGMGAMDVRRAVLDNHVRQTLALGEAIADGRAPQPDFVLWPENSTDIDPFADPTVAEAITAAARTVNAPILVGAVTSVPGNPDGVWNVGIVWDPVAGPVDQYIKTHPVPFGEFVPFRAQLAPLIGRLDRVPRDFIAGTEPGNLTIGGVDIGNVICFEIAYREVVDAVVDGGARLLTVQTNNATYGGTAQPEQQLAIERTRAAETGRTVLVAATSGISAVIEADGTISQRMDEDQTGWLVTEAALHDTTTPATRFGSWLELLICLVGVAAIAVAIARTVARRRQEEQTAAGDDAASPRLAE